MLKAGSDMPNWIMRGLERYDFTHSIDFLPDDVKELVKEAIALGGVVAGIE